MFNNFFFFGNSAAYEIIWKKYCRAGQATGKQGACSLHARYLRLQTHTPIICNTHCFSTATVVARTRLNVTLYAHCLSRLKLFSVLPQFRTERCACCCSDVCRPTYILLFAGLATTVRSPSNLVLPTVEQRSITTREHHDGFERVSIGSFMEDNS